jgi:hypothetical protein
MARPSAPLAPIAGAVALALAMATVVVEATHGGSLSMTASAVLGAAGGGVGLWQYDRLPALVAADALLAAAVLLGLWGFAALFVVPLVAMGVATLSTSAHQTPARHLAPSRFAATAFAAGPLRRPRRAERQARVA